MAAEDWKGVAMILQQLGQMAQPSKLDVIDKEYELRSLEKQADREHEFKLKNYEAMQKKYEEQQATYQDLINKGSALHSELNDMKEIDYSGNANKVMESIYNGKYDNFEAGMKMQGEFIKQLQDEIILAQQVNKAGTIGKDFTGTWAATGADDKQINYAKDFDIDGSGDLNYDEKMSAIDAESIRRYGEEETDQGNAFKLVAKGQVDAEKELGESKAQEKEKLADSSKMSKEDKLNWEIYKSQEKYIAKNKAKIADAESKIGRVINDLYLNPNYVDNDGKLKFHVMYAQKDDALVNTYKDYMNRLTKAGVAYKYRPPVLDESDFKQLGVTGFKNKMPGYDYDAYQLVASGKDANGNDIPLERYKYMQREFEWYINTSQQSDNAKTYDPRNGNEIPVSERREAFEYYMYEMYGV
tara:strand:- start:2841 stop:4079 length:1239 start_codon:yes stop_codon:yes gene_type:complete